MEELKFEWDQAEEMANVKKHGVSFCGSAYCAFMAKKRFFRS